MDATQQQLIAALARRLNGQRSPVARPPVTAEQPDELDVLIDLDAPADDVVDLAGG